MVSVSASVRKVAARNACVVLPAAARAFHSARVRLANENVFSATDMDFDQKVMMVWEICLFLVISGWKKKKQGNQFTYSSVH